MVVMTYSEKKFFGKLAIIWAVVTGLVTLFFACILPDSAPVVIIVGILIYLVIFVILNVFQWLNKD